MGKFSILTCFILCCSVLCVYCQLPILQDVEDKATKEGLPLILKFLNDDVEAIINYKSGTIKHSQLKGDILEVDITTAVTCKSSLEQCSYESADCRGLLFIKPNAEMQVISVDCNPNLPVEEPIALPVRDEYCEGCFVDVNVNAEGVKQLANNVIQHVESEKMKKYYLIEILKVQRQVADGVNFIITVLIGRPPSVCGNDEKCERDKKEDMYCVVKFFQEPGYLSPKNIMSNNCTQTQTFLPIIPKYQSSEKNLLDVDDKGDNKGKDFYPKKNEMSENDILKDIISQIIPSDEFVSKSIPNSELSQPNPVKILETSSINNMPDESSQPMIISSTFQEVLATEDEPISVGTDTSTNEDEMENNNASSLIDTTSKVSSTVEENPQMALHQIEDNTEITSGTASLKEEGTSEADSTTETLVREKRSLLGGKQEIAVDNPKIKEYTEEAVNYLNSKLSEGDNQLKIGRILSATSQVVSGVSYDVRTELIDCHTDGNSIQDCESAPRICDINIWYRPWLESRIITIKCGDESYTVDTLKPKNREKRGVPGGWSQKDHDDPNVSKHLKVLLNNLDSQSGMDNKLKIKKVLSTSTQVVAGTNWDIRAKVVRSNCLKSENKEASSCGDDTNTFETVCNFKFWEKLPDKNRERKLANIEINCEDPKLNYRVKRNTHQRKTREVLVGGHHSLSTDDPRLLKHLGHLLPQLDSLSNKDHKLKIKNVISATSQVVAGTNWNINAVVSLSDCKKSDNKLSANCGENKDSYETICNFKFWERLPDRTGLRKLDNVEINCEDSKLTSRGRREAHIVSAQKNEPDKDLNILGELLNVDENEPIINVFITESLQHMDLNSPHDNQYKVKEILSSTKQAAASGTSGYLWKIKVAVILSDCDKKDITDRAQCSELPEAEPKQCLIRVWEKPRIDQGHEISIKCDEQKNSYFFRVKKPNQDHSAAFREFESKYAKEYTSPRERIKRYSIFQNNMKIIKMLNEHEQGTATYGPTKFADLTQEEFSKGLGYRSDLRSENDMTFENAVIPDIDLPDSFDWRDKNAVAAVKDQGSCGSCWAFSVTGNVEGQYAIKNGKLLEFSEQELVDCDTVDKGCNGGLMDNAYRQIEKLGGLEEEQQYPYDARDEKCHFNRTLVRVQLAGAVNISQDESEMAKWLVKNGPISIAINANAMQFYMGGVSHPWKVLCNPNSLDHGVLIVGYGVHTYPKFKKSLPYWIVKNSWGKSWGEQGYYRVYRGDGTCGVNQTPSSAILK